MLLLELRYFGEVELSHLHGWDYHIKRFLAARAHWSSHLLHVRKHVNQALVEAEIAHAVANLAVFYVKGTVASHSREDFFVGINFTDVPQPVASIGPTLSLCSEFFIFSAVARA